jgi:ABC-type dipeptide/oligopeptide/nickel transport system permease component
MASYLLRRLLGFIFVVLAVSFITFLLMWSTPGGPFDETNMPLSPAAKANIIAKYGLDQPFYVQWAKYMINAVQGDFGYSFKYPGTKVTDLFARYWGTSILLGALAVLWSFPLGMVLGVLAALNRNRLLDQLITGLSLISATLPTFALAFFSLAIFAVALKWVPYGGWKPTSDIRTLILPVIIFGLGTVGSLARYVRSGLLDVLGQDYIRTARAKGVRHNKVIFKHAMRNMLVPIVTIFGPVLTNAITGSAFVERWFIIPGIGNFFLDSITFRDYPVIMASVLIIAVILTLTFLLTDIAYTLLDPRIRLT